MIALDYECKSIVVNLPDGMLMDNSLSGFSASFSDDDAIDDDCDPLVEINDAVDEEVDEVEVEVSIIFRL